MDDLSRKSLGQHSRLLRWTGSGSSTQSRFSRHVSPFSLYGLRAHIKVYRILIAFNNTFPRKNNLRYGALSQQSKNFRQLGRKSATIPSMLSTKQQLTMALQNSTNTILGLTRNRAIYSALVSKVISLLLSTRYTQMIISSPSIFQT